MNMFKDTGLDKVSILEHFMFLRVCIAHVLFYLMLKLQVSVIIHNCIN